MEPIEEIRKKYPRSLHAQISLGTTSDDRFHSNGYVKVFSEMSDLILLEKIDGENNAFKKDGLFARSHVASTESPWTKPLRERWNLIKNDLGDLELFGEGMFGIHSIAYSKLESYYYLFAARIKDQWLSWDEVKFYAAMFDFPTAPEIKINISLKDYYKEGVNENDILAKWLEINLGMTWQEYVETPGLLGGYDCITNESCNEGFVLRNKNGFKINEGLLPVEENEFDSLLKIVRKKHVKTDIHWTKTWKPAKLIDYSKFNWQSYEYLNTKK